MPTYRYYTKDLLTGAVQGELELYGVYASRTLSQPGQFTGSIKLTDNAFINNLNIQASTPGRNAIYIERNGVDIWGGILWTRTYNNQSRAFELTGQTFESYFDHIVLEDHFIQQKVNQEIIFQNLVNQCQGMASSNIGLTLGTLPTTNTPRTVLIPGYEFHFASEAINQIVGVDNGLEYTIDPDKTLRIGYPELGAANAALSFDYPGSITNYWMPESGAAGGVKFAALGYGTGNKVARAVAVNQDDLTAGYPAWWVVNQYSGIADLQLLQDKVTKDAQRYSMPFKKPSFELKSDVGVGFTGWNNLGDTFDVHIEDVRYPSGGLTINSRMIGWEFWPADSANFETIKFTIDGSDVA